MGTLYLVGTPIGNLGDITKRALDILNRVDIIACEDTRTTQKLLSHYDIQKRLIAHHSHNQRNSTKGIMELLKQGKDIALVSDSGMPVLSDPGEYLIREARTEGIPIDTAPGPTALTTAITLTPLPAPYIFGGFSPAKTGNLKKLLNKWLPTKTPLILYESPHRAERLLQILTEDHNNPTVTIARELTKIHQNIIQATASQILENHTPKIKKGELVIIIHPETS